MKKITFLIAIIFAVSSLMAQTAPLSFKWYGAQTDQVWDYSTANWLDPAFPIPLPKTFTEGATAIFDDSSVEGSDTIKISGIINVADVQVNATKTYVLRRVGTTDTLKGTGTFIKDGSGLFVMDLPNLMNGGTLVKNGKLMMEKQTTPNIFGPKLVLEGGIVNFATTTSSNYPSITVPIEIPAGKTGVIECSRYSYFSSPISGSGDLTIYAGGERTYLGQKNVQPDWSKFTGNVRVEEYVMSGVNPGFRGLVLNTNKTFKDTLDGQNIDSTFYNRRLTLGSKVQLVAESGSRAYAIGELISEDSTTVLAGYYKESTTPNIRYYVGGLNTDVIYKGRIAECNGAKKGYNKVGFYKVGTGTYTLTHHNNNIIGGIVVIDGTLNFSDEVWRGTYRGSAGNNVLVKSRGTVGGTGRIQGNVDVFGNLKPGNNGVGTLLITDSLALNPLSKYDIPVSYSFTYNNTTGTPATYTYRNGGNRAFNLNLHAGSVSEFEIESTRSYDKVIASGKLKFGPDTSAIGKPKIKIVVKPNATINDGDKFEIIKTRTVDATSGEFDIEFPQLQGITWNVEAKYDTVKVDQEEFTHTTKVVTKTNADSTAVTVFKTDGEIVNYKVIVKAKVGSGVKNVTNNTVRVFPNPTSGMLTFNSEGTTINAIEIISVQGQIIENRPVKTGSVSFDLSHLPSGVYYARIKTDTGTEMQKIMLK